MYTDILRSIEGIGVFPVVSLLVFVTVFSIVLIWAFRADATRLAAYARLPLDPSTRPEQGRGARSGQGRTE